MLKFILISLASIQLHAQLVIVVARHGTAEHNIEGVHNSNPSHPNYKPSHLTPLGIEQITASAEKVKTNPLVTGIVDAVYTSPLPRAVQTAHILCEKGELIPKQWVEDTRLIEVQAGPLEGKPFIPNWNPSYAQKYGCETDDQIQSRVEEFYQELLTHHTSGMVVVVTHGVIAQKLLSILTSSTEKPGLGEANVVVLP